MKGLLKRIARRILRDELARSAAELVRLDEAGFQLRLDLNSVARSRDAWRDSYNTLNGRTSRALAWAVANSQPGTPARCLAEWTHKGTGGSGFGIVHPFDRWGISPKP